MRYQYWRQETQDVSLFNYGKARFVRENDTASLYYVLVQEINPSLTHVDNIFYSQPIARAG